MKKILIVFCLTFSLVYSQQFNKKIVDERTNKMMLIGICNKDAFADSNYSAWFSAEYDNYKSDSVAVSKIISADKFTIKIVMGTWCSDSRREVPRFYKILDAIGYNFGNLKLVCVDRNKKSEEGNVEALDIKFVPTFIFYRGGIEIGRIIESPKKKLEEDILEIVTK